MKYHDSVEGKEKSYTINISKDSKIEENDDIAKLGVN